MGFGMTKFEILAIIGWDFMSYLNYQLDKLYAYIMADFECI